LLWFAFVLLSTEILESRYGASSVRSELACSFQLRIPVNKLLCTLLGQDYNSES